MEKNSEKSHLAAAAVGNARGVSGHPSRDLPAPLGGVMGAAAATPRSHCRRGRPGGDVANPTTLFDVGVGRANLPASSICPTLLRGDGL